MYRQHTQDLSIPPSQARRLARSVADILAAAMIGTGLAWVAVQWWFA